MNNSYNGHTTLKEKILKGEMTDEDLLHLFVDKTPAGHHRKQHGSFFKAILKGFIDVYTAPNMWRLSLEAFLIFMVIAGIIFLSDTGHIDAMITSVLFAFILGFLFGKIK